MSKKLVITYSERQAYRNCPALHGYSYVEALRPEREAEPLRMGTLLHRVMAEGLRAAYKPDLSWDIGHMQALHFLRCALEDMVSEAECMHQGGEERIAEVERNRAWLTYAVDNYFVTNRSDYDRYVPMGIELSCEVPVRDAIGRSAHLWHAGSIDLPMWDQEVGRVVVMDHKSTAGDPQLLERKLQLDEQTAGYLYMLRERLREGRPRGRQGIDWPPQLSEPPLGDDPNKKFTGVVYNVFRKSYPKVPSLNKITKADCPHLPLYEELKAKEAATGQHQGKVSAAAIDTTQETYEEALVDQVGRMGLKPTDKQKARNDSLGSVAPYFQRIEYHRTEADLERWRREAWAEGRRIRMNYRDERERTRNAGHCTGVASYACAYQAICVSGEPQSARQGDVIGYRRVDPKEEEGVRGYGKSRGSAGGDNPGGDAERRPSAGANHRFF